MASWHLRLGRNPGPQKETIEKVFQSSIFTGKNKLAGFVSGRVFSSFSEKNMMRCQTPTSHAGLVRSLTCSIQDSISVFFRKLTPIRKTYQKKSYVSIVGWQAEKGPQKSFPISAWFQVFWFTCTILIYLDVCSHEISYGTWLRDDFCLPLEVGNGL